MAFPLRNSDQIVVSVSFDFPSNFRRDVPFHCIAFYYSLADWNKLHSYSAAVIEICEWVQVGIDVYIPLCKYQTKEKIYNNYSFSYWETDKGKDC